MKTLAEYPVDHLDYSTNFIEMNNSLIVQGNKDKFKIIYKILHIKTNLSDCFFNGLLFNTI